MRFLAHENEVMDTLSNQMQGSGERETRRRDPFLLGCLVHQEAHGVMRYQQGVEFLKHSDRLATAKESILLLLVDFDLIEGDFLFPTGMIRLEQVPLRIGERVQERGYQPVHLPMTGTSRVIEGILDQPHHSSFARR